MSVITCANLGRPCDLAFLAAIFVRDLPEERLGMVEDGIAEVVVEFLKVREERGGNRAYGELVPKPKAADLSRKGTQLAFRPADVDFIPLTVAWFRLLVLEACVCACVRACEGAAAAAVAAAAAAAAVDSLQLAFGIWQQQQQQ